MVETSAAIGAPGVACALGAGNFKSFVVIGTMAFLTLVDLFATQAILPPLREYYGVTPAAMGAAVNATTIGMAISSALIRVTLIQDREQLLPERPESLGEAAAKSLMWRGVEVKLGVRAMEASASGVVLATGERVG